MPLPETLSELAALGYRRDSVGTCRGCGMTMLWFITPKNARMPFALKAGTVDQYVPHWANCPKADQFRRPRIERKDKRE